eukprot:scaffold3818_cov260-Chaetoceros_neogracile.AAC.4
MKLPLWQLFVTKSWERELAQNCVFAFKSAVAGLISKAFQVPLIQIENTDEFVKYDSAKVDHNQTKEAEIHVKDDELNAAGTMDDSEDDDQYIRAMVEENLLKLYMRDETGNDADQEKKNSITEVFLSIKPINSRLESIFLIPSMTRDDVKENESLRGAYREIEGTFQETGNMKLVTDMANDLIERVPHGGTKRSIIMDISIDCIERFYVKAGEKLIQGDDDSEEKEVTHLVRFEMQTTKGENVQDRELGSWYVIDIDDQCMGLVSLDQLLGCLTASFNYSYRHQLCGISCEEVRVLAGRPLFQQRLFLSNGSATHRTIQTDQLWLMSVKSKRTEHRTFTINYDL